MAIMSFYSLVASGGKVSHSLKERTIKEREKDMNGYTGGLLEADTFPTVQAGARAREYVNYVQAMGAWEKVKTAQPWSNPAEPDPRVSRFAANLHTAVAMILMGQGGDWSCLCLYTAAGSALDWHGIDAFFELAGARVTLDVTANPAKLNGYRANIIVPPEAVEEESVRDDLARMIAQELLDQLAAAERIRLVRQEVTHRQSRRLRRW